MHERSTHCFQSSTNAHCRTGVVTTADEIGPVITGNLSFVMSTVYVDGPTATVSRVFTARWAITLRHPDRSTTLIEPICPTSVLAIGILLDRPLKILDAPCRFAQRNIRASHWSVAYTTDGRSITVPTKSVASAGLSVMTEAFMQAVCVLVWLFSVFFVVSRRGATTG